MLAITRLWQTRSGTSDCCPAEQGAQTAAAKQPAASSCCPSESAAVAEPRRRFDYMLWGSAVLVTLGYVAHLLFGGSGEHSQLAHFASGTYELMNS